MAGCERWQQWWLIRLWLKVHKNTVHYLDGVICCGDAGDCGGDGDDLVIVTM